MCVYITTVLWSANFSGWLSYWNILLAIKTDSMEKSTLENLTVVRSRNSSHFIEPICLLFYPRNTFHGPGSQIISFLFCGCYRTQGNRVSSSRTQKVLITATQINCCTMFVTPQTQPVQYILSLDTTVYVAIFSGFSATYVDPKESLSGYCLCTWTKLFSLQFAQRYNIIYSIY